MSVENHKKVFIWAHEVLDLIERKRIGGIAVQMYFWAQIFFANGWDVYSLTYGDETIIEGICFKRHKSVRRINFFLEWWYAIKYVLSVNPEIIICRGANRNLFPLTIMANLFKRKLIFFGASDVNFEPGKEITATGFNGECYRWAIPLVSKIITQNQHQYDTLLQNYGRDSLIMSNLWGSIENGTIEEKKYDVIWVANFRRLKRAEWVLEAARNHPFYAFAMVGGPDDKEYFEELRRLAVDISNVSFLGARSFFESNALIMNSRVLLCTSTFEGFPNTFLQAWSYRLPVISTVDPSGVIQANGLGEVISSVRELSQSIESILSDSAYYDQLRNNIENYFDRNHSAQSKYDQLMKYVGDLSAVGGMDSVTGAEKF